MPHSAQRSMRNSRSDLFSKAGAPSQVEDTLSTTDIEVPAEPTTGITTVDVIEVKQPVISPVPPLGAQQQPLVESEQEAASSTSIQPRRSMQRARKPSSRLLPSPSPPPPPSRSSSNNHHHSPSKAATMNTIASSAPKNTQKKQQAATPTLLEVNDSSSNNIVISPSPLEEEEYGPGKRKRRPSTMSKPPSTITRQALPASVSQGSILPAPSSGPTSLKIRLNRVASKSQSPEEKSQSSKGPRKSRVDEPAQATSLVGHDSDSTTRAARIETDGDADHEEDSDAGPSIVPATRRLGHVRIKVHPLSAAREKFGGRRWPTSNGVTLLEPPPLISRRGGLKAAHQGLAHTSQRTVKIGGSESNHQRAQSTSVLDGRWAWNPSAIAPTLRFRLSGHAGDEEVSEASDLDDEDDFHVAMLDGGDFGIAHHGKAASLSSKGSHRDSKSGDDSEGEDTPATTPRSPQSTCDLPERRWSTGADDEEKENNSKAKKDSVFAHALETSSRRPHTHAGSLTLSLPFEEMTQGNEEDAAASTLKGNADYEASEKEDEDSSIAAGLLSPAVQHTILGLSSKQHALMLSSPHTSSSTFTSPAMGPSVQDIKTEPLPLSLPPPASLLQARDNLKKRMKERHAHLSEMSSSALHSDEEGDEAQEVFAVSVMDPPERMCLSELDRAWEQSEYLTKARRMANDPEDDPRSEVDIEKLPVKDQSRVQSEVVERATRGSKRLSIGVPKEEPESKKPKTSPKSKTIQSPGRRSARHSGVKA